MRRTNVVIFGMPCGTGNDLKMDIRKPPENLYAMRKMIVRLHRQGLTPMAIREQTDVDWDAIRKAMDLYAEGGVPDLKPKPRGCRKGHI